MVAFPQRSGSSFLRRRRKVTTAPATATITSSFRITFSPAVRRRATARPGGGVATLPLLAGDPIPRSLRRIRAVDVSAEAATANSAVATGGRHGVDASLDHARPAPRAADPATQQCLPHRSSRLMARCLRREGIRASHVFVADFGVRMGSGRTDVVVRALLRLVEYCRQHCLGPVRRLAPGPSRPPE